MFPAPPAPNDTLSMAPLSVFRMVPATRLMSPPFLPMTPVAVDSPVKSVDVNGSNESRIPVMTRVSAFTAMFPALPDPTRAFVKMADPLLISRRPLCTVALPASPCAKVAAWMLA